jgi:hypothetical protein
VGGRYTDIVVIDEGGVHFLHEDALKALADAYRELMQVHTTTHTDIQARIDALELKWI